MVCDVELLQNPEGFVKQNEEKRSKECKTE